MKKGEYVKVFLKGESPWGIVTKITDETHMEAKINNNLVNTAEHGVSFGDIVPFELREIVEGHPSWEHNL
jgi:predicted ATPase